MFKIVETVENKKKKLSVVPSNWENNGVLLWPKRHVESSISDPNSKPDPDENWYRYTCKLKINYLPNKTTANKELNQMLKKGDTEDEKTDHEEIEKPLLSKRTIRKKPINSVMASQSDLSKIVEECCSKKTAKEKFKISAKESNQTVSAENHTNDSLLLTATANVHQTEDTLTFSASSSILDANIDNDISYETEDHAISNKSLESDIPALVGDETLMHILSNENIPKLEIFQQKLDKIEENQIKIQYNQEKIIERFSKIETMFEEFIKAYGTKNIPTPGSENLSQFKPSIVPFKPIQTVNEMDDIEEKLNDENLFKEFVAKFSYICGSNKNNKAIDNCYLLVDHFFTRNIITMCSWTGGSKEKIMKICF